MKAIDFLNELSRQQKITTLQVKLEAIIDRKCEIRRELENMEREQVEVTSKLKGIK